MKNNQDESGYVGRYSADGRIVAAGKFFAGTLGIHSWRDGEFHYDPRHEKMYYEGEYDDITDEEFEEFKARMDSRGQTDRDNQNGEEGR